jgi:hypothetical protein
MAPGAFCLEAQHAEPTLAFELNGIDSNILRVTTFGATTPCDISHLFSCRMVVSVVVFQNFTDAVEAPCSKLQGIFDRRER